MDGIKNVIPMSCRHEVIEKEAPLWSNYGANLQRLLRMSVLGVKIMTTLSIMANMSLLWIGKKEKQLNL